MFLKRYNKNLILITRNFKKQSCWEDEDCCGKKLFKPKPEQIVVEKACCPCSFMWYEHKKPVLKPRPLIEIEEDTGVPKDSELCYPGKVYPNVDYAKVKEDGIKCLARTTVAASLKLGALKSCPKKEGHKETQYKKLDDVFKDPKIPEATWNSDCEF